GMAAANPSMGYLISYAVLLSDAKNDPEWVFRTECLCQWSDGALEGVFPAGTWEEQLDQESAVAPGERIVGCLTVNWERSRSYIAIAGKRTDGRTHIGVVASRSGTDWIKDYLAHPDAPPLRTLVIQERGAPESSLIEELQGSRRADGEPIRILKWGGQDLAAAHGTFYDKVRLGADGPLRHRSQPALEVAVATSVTRPLQDAWVIDLRKSAGDAAPLKATIGAVWGLESSASRVSAYESEDAFDSSEDEEEAYELMVLWEEQHPWAGSTGCSGRRSRRCCGARRRRPTRTTPTTPLSACCPCPTSRTSASPARSTPVVSPSPTLVCHSRGRTRARRSASGGARPTSATSSTSSLGAWRACRSTPTSVSPTPTGSASPTTPSPARSRGPDSAPRRSGSGTA